MAHPKTEGASREGIRPHCWLLLPAATGIVTTICSPACANSSTEMLVLAGHQNQQSAPLVSPEGAAIHLEIPSLN